MEKIKSSWLLKYEGVDLGEYKSLMEAINFSWDFAKRNDILYTNIELFYKNEKGEIEKYDRI